MSNTLSRLPAGLSQEQAVRQLERDGPNELPADARVGLSRQVWNVVRQPILGLLIAAGIINFVLSEPLDGTILMVFVSVIVGISIYQGHKTENALAALRDMSSPRALVLRDGAKVRIPGREVVRGDVILIAEGDRVPADAVLIETRGVMVDESALTGESVPVSKTCASKATDEVDRPGGEPNHSLFLGTLVVKGQGVAAVRATGVRTELGRIGSSLRRIEIEPTALQREIDRIVRVVAVAGLIVASAVVVAHGLARGGWLQGLLLGIATAMSMLPEEFPVVLTVFLALGSWRLAQRRVLTRRSAAIETLGSATVVCVDKTGTITQNRMEVHELIVDGERHELDGSRPPTTLWPIIEWAVLASPPDPFDPMDKAFRRLGERTFGTDRRLGDGLKMLREYPLSADLMALSHVWQSTESGAVVVASKGAPEAVFDLCHLDAHARKVVMKQVEASSARGLRVLAVARASLDGTRALAPDQHEYDFEFVGLAGLRDPVRPGVAESIGEFTRAGVRTVMITGDYPGTGVAVAREIGLPNCDDVVTGSELDSMSDEDLALRARSAGVFARMVPEQKLRLVRALKADGEVVGMTGDGVNDAPALRAADIGIAMGARGTDVAREAADLVIADDDFSSIVNGVRQGRGIFDNLRKALSYVIAMHVPIVGMVLVPLLGTDWPLVLLPVQIAFVELIIDPACSVVFECEQIDPRVMERPPRSIDEPLFPIRVVGVALLQGFGVLASGLGVYWWSMWRDMEPASTRSVTFATVILSNIALILVNRSWRLTAWRTFAERRNTAVKWIVAGASLMLTAVLTVPWLRDALDFGSVTWTQVAVATVAAVLGVAWFEVYKLTRGTALSGTAARAAGTTWRWRTGSR